MSQAAFDNAVCVLRHNTACVMCARNQRCRDTVQCKTGERCYKHPLCLIFNYFVAVLHSDIFLLWVKFFTTPTLYEVEMHFRDLYIENGYTPLKLLQPFLFLETFFWEPPLVCGLIVDNLPALNFSGI